MRESRTAQQSIFHSATDHEIADELRGMSKWLDEHPELLDLVACDIGYRGGSKQGRSGMTIDSVLRCAILKQYRQVDYRSLAFYLRDSASFIEFARFESGRRPSKSSLQGLISAIRASTWEALQRCLREDAAQHNIESGEVIRIDATVTDMAILEPADSGLLYDAVRVMVRLLKSARSFGEVTFHNHQRLAKRRRHAIFNARRNDRRRPLYKDLLKTTIDTLGYLDNTYKTLQKQPHSRTWRDKVDHYRPLILKVIQQTQRRVIDGERVPVEDKIVSLFEAHTDIIVKGQREVQYGHKLTLSAGQSGLVLDTVVETGNPSDQVCFVAMLHRHIDHFGAPPKAVAADGGYSSQANLDRANALGVKHVAFHKRVGLSVEAMTGDRWLYNKLRNFRAGIEAIISYLKRCFGLSRCNWKGLDHFKAYVHSAVFTHNLVILTRRLAAPG
ncbi:MAG: IS5 family transposase [Limisphaerales bacterium]|jgi:IS5 family transposase